MDDAAGPGTNSVKRARDESDDSPDAKRLRAVDRILLDILEEADPVDRDSGDLATVIRSFEEEIAALSPCAQQQQQPVEDGATRVSAAPASAPGSEGTDRSDLGLGYLLEASDDDLGLPPTLQPSSEEGEAVGGDVAADGNQGLTGLGQLWGLEDENPSCYDALGFGELTQDDAGTDGGVAFDRLLFGYPDVVSSGPSDFSDFSWQLEFLSTV